MKYPAPTVKPKKIAMKIKMKRMLNPVDWAEAGRRLKSIEAKSVAFFPELDELANEMTNDNTMIPMMSSMMAAETSAEPIFVSNLPNSFKVATVTETLVAVRMTP